MQESRLRGDMDSALLQDLFPCNRNPVAVLVIVAGLVLILLYPNVLQSSIIANLHRKLASTSSVNSQRYSVTASTMCFDLPAETSTPPSLDNCRITFWARDRDTLRGNNTRNQRAQVQTGQGLNWHRQSEVSTVRMLKGLRLCWTLMSATVRTHSSCRHPLHS